MEDLAIEQGYGKRIVPFNHPISFAAGRLAAPLMAGNSVIVKPPEQAPLSASILAEVCAEVLPPGLVNIVTGTGPVAGDAIVPSRDQAHSLHRLGADGNEDPAGGR